MANDKWSGSNPWLGLAPYTEGTPLYGRTKESIQLADIIKDYTASVVFGKSGIGKSSLLSAGISPLLREENYIPVRIRLVHNTEISYIEQIESKVRETVHCIDRLPSDVNNLGLWDFFHRHSFTTEDGIDCIPVIILDQFEEIYTLTDVDHKKDIVTFFNELSSLLNDIKPDNVIEEERKHSAVQNDSGSVTPKRGIIKRSAASALNYASATTFRFVICLREDKLYLLERNSANIPSLKANRYNLQALSAESALEVIMCPRPELFSNEEATAIIDKLADMGDEGIRAVDPAIISLYLFVLFEKKGKIDEKDIFSHYYKEVIKEIKNKQIRYLEKKLLTEDGCRLQLPINELLGNNIAQKVIQSLHAKRVITIEERKNIKYIEFSHDLIAREAFSSRKEFLFRKETRLRRNFLISAIILSLLIMPISKYIDYLNRKIDCIISFCDLNPNNQLPTIDRGIVTVEMNGVVIKDTIFNNKIILSQIPNNQINKEIHLVVNAKGFIPIDTIINLAEYNKLNVKRDTYSYGKICFTLWNSDTEAPIPNCPVTIVSKDKKYNTYSNEEGIVKYQIPIEEQRVAYSIYSNKVLIEETILYMPCSKYDVIIAR